MLHRAWESLSNYVHPFMTSWYISSNGYYRNNNIHPASMPVILEELQGGWFLSPVAKDDTNSQNFQRSHEHGNRTTELQQPPQLIL